MAEKDNGGPQYSGQDMARMLHDLLYGDEGILANTVLSRPRDIYSAGLDRATYTADQTRKDYFDKYLKQITRVPTLNRQKSLAAASGLGDKLMSSMDMLFDYSPSTVMDIMQHHGGDQAAATFLSMNNGIAAARGVSLGGIGSPMQQSYNMKFAASQGALAYKNNFNKDGTVNIDQTHGVSLPIAALIASKTMSDRSQYTNWADRMSKKGPGLSADEMELDSREIENFKNGIGTTARAEKSFNEQIKKFTEGINQFVASVSRMTGDYLASIDFLQKATGGKLFSAGEDAARSREKASKIVYGLRAAAADAGISKEGMMSMVNWFGKRADFAGGHDERSSLLNRNPTTTRMGALAAAGMAKWKQMNPNATAEELARASMAMEDRVDNYMTGDAYKMNTIAAYMVDNGLLDKNEWEELSKSGNAPLMFKRLSKTAGGEGRLRQMMGDSRQLEMMSMNHADTAFDFHKATFAGGGVDQEMIRKGSRKLFETYTRNFASEQSVERENKAKQIEKDLGISRRDLLLDRKTLEEAGVKKPEKLDALIRDAESYGYTEEEILKKLYKYGGKASKLEAAADEKMIAAASEKYGADSEQVKLLKSPKKASDIDKRVAEIEREAMLDDKALDAAGITDEKRKEKLKHEARTGKWSADAIRKYITNVERGNVAYSDIVSNQITYTKLAEEFGEDSPAVKNLKKGIDRIQGAMSLSTAQKESYSEVLTSLKTNDIQSLKDKIKSEKDPGKRADLQRELNSMVESGLSGKNGYIAGNNDYLETLLTNGLKDQNMSQEDQKAYIESAKKIFNSAIEGGASVDAAFAMVKNTKEKDLGAKFKDDFDSTENRKAAFDKAKSRQTLAAAVRTFTKETDINLSSEELESKMLEAYRLFDEERENNPEADDETIVSQILRPVFKDQIGDKEKLVEPLLKDLQEGKGDLYDAMEKESTRFKSDSVRADKASFVKRYEKAVNPQRMKAIGDAAIEEFEKGGQKIDRSKYEQSLKKLQEGADTKGLSHEELVKRAIEETTGEKVGQNVSSSIDNAALGFDTDKEGLLKLIEPLFDEKNVDDELKKKVMAEAGRLTVDKVHSGDNIGTIYGYAAGENSVAQFHTNANTSMVKGGVQESYEAIFGGNLAKVIEEQDNLSAKEANKQVASFTGKNLERIEKQLNVEEKMKALGEAKTQLLTSVVDDKGEKLSGQKDLAAAFAAFNSENKGISDNDYEANFKKRFGDDGFASLKELREKHGISMREAVAAIGAGSEENDATKRAQKEKAAYIDEHIKNGSPELSKDSELAGYLFRLVELTEKIAGQQSEGIKVFK